MEMILNGESLKFQIDSGATVNVIPKKFIQTELEPAPIVLKMYNNTTMQAEGRAKLKHNVQSLHYCGMVFWRDCQFFQVY